jgi:uncharacterized protein YjbK
MAIQTEPGLFDALDPEVTALEFKVTVRRGEERKVEAELKRTRATRVRRTVYFYDTLDRDLAAQHLFLRGRVTEDDDDQSTIKLRPLPASGVPAHWRVPKLEIEADVVGAELIPAVKIDRKLDPGRIVDVANKILEPSKLFNDHQEAIIKAAGIELNHLQVLGPIDARKWTLPDDTLPPYEVCVEEWSLPDASRFLEISFKLEDVSEAESALKEFHGLLDRLKIGYEGDPRPKTLIALKFFADRLR